MNQESVYPYKYNAPNDRQQGLLSPTHVMLVSTLLVGALGWGTFVGVGHTINLTTSTIENASANFYRWSAGGTGQVRLRYAIEPDLCSAMHPLLWEENAIGTWAMSWRSNFSSCDRIHQLIRDAFAVWQEGGPPPLSMLPSPRSS